MDSRPYFRDLKLVANDCSADAAAVAAAAVAVAATCTRAETRVR